MAGYSGTPLWKKLGVKPEQRILVLNDPPGFLDSLELDGSQEVRSDLRRTGDLLVAFFHRRAEFERRLTTLKNKLDPYGGLWIGWPKKASKVPTDMTEDLVREAALQIGLVDNKVCAIDDVYSGLRLCVRVADRPKR